MGINVGIDLGTSNSVISYFKRGRVETLPLDGKNTFPSVISIKNSETLTGEPAKARLIIDRENSVGSSKRDIGTDMQYNIGGKLMTPILVEAEILKAMKEKAEFTTGEKIDGAVITVPAYFTSRQREDTKKAAEEAGLNVLRLMPEPTAAALCYGLNQNKDQTIMVYDLGGGTFDVSILKVVGNEFEVVAVDGDARLGGDDFDEKICLAINNRIINDTGIDLSLKNDREAMGAKQKLKEAAEKAKIQLSDMENAEIIIPNLMPNYHLDMEITRDDYYEIIKPLIEKTIDKMKSVLVEANMTTEDVDRVILVGGSTKSPLIKNAVKEYIRDPYTASNVDEVVSNGAAIMAATISMPDDQKLENRILNIKVKDITTHSYGTDIIDDKFDPIIPKGAKLPAKSGRIYFTVCEYQENVNMNVYMGESENLSENTKIESFSIEISEPQKQSVAVGAIFEMDENMIIHFTSVEIQDNPFTRGIIEDSVNKCGNLNIEKVEELIALGRVKHREIDIDGNRKGI